MNIDPKLMLSDDEMKLVIDTSWILTKRSVLEKVDGLLVHLAEAQRTIIENEIHWLPGEVIRSEPKIARGENYMQLPYRLLDYPRCFDATNIFAVRTMFWWGNFFSITLHLSGKYKGAFQQKILQHISSTQENIFICIHESQWQHHFEADNYIPVKQLSGSDIAETLLKKDFIKLAIKFPLQPWAVLPALLDKTFLELIKLLKD